MVPSINTDTSPKFTITYRAYLDGKEIDSKTIDITVAQSPSVRLNINGAKNGVVAFGQTLDIGVTSKNQVNWELSTDIVGGVEKVLNSIEPIWIDSTKAQLTIKTLAELGDSYTDYIGKDISITAKVVLNVNGVTYTATDTVVVRLALYTIDGISVKYVDESIGKFVGIYNQPYDLRVILKASYDEEFDANHDGVISSKISKLEDELSKASAGTFSVISGDILVPLVAGEKYSDFQISANGEYLTIKNNAKNPSSILQASVKIEYTAKAEGGVRVNPSITTSDFVFDPYCRFGLQFTRLSNEENPEPIYTEKELRNMEEGGYYILLSDITVSDWAPLNTPIASLDGNGYVITIKNFYNTTITSDSNNEESTNRQLTLGLFSEISEKTTIKNLILEVKNDESIISDDAIIKNPTTGLDEFKNADLSIDVANYSQVTFGLLAGVNKGIVTNVKVTNNANSHRNERNEMLAQRGLISEYQIGETINKSYFINENNQKESVQRYLTKIALDYGSVTTSAKHNIGGLVGVNEGYISNSNINNISIFGLNRVAGFVAENKENAIIASSYFKGGNIVSQVSSASGYEAGSSAFVFENAGRIAYSYASSTSQYPKNLTGITDLENFVGVGYDNLGIRLKNTGAISIGGNSSGFVFKNSGSIQDSYANLLVRGSYSVGFVFENSGIINNVYTLASGVYDKDNNYPFIAMEDLTNGVARDSGDITNAYFLKAISSDFETEGEKNKDIITISDQEKQKATAISISKLSSYNTFETFAFAPNYDDILNKEDAIKKTVGAVWFYPNILTNSSVYFQDSYYTFGTPQLVSANLNTMSLKYYVSDSTSKIVESVYANILLDYSDITYNFSRDNIQPTIIECNGVNLINAVNNNLDSTIATAISKSEIVTTLNSYNDIYKDYKFSDIKESDFEKLLYQYIKVDIYLEKEGFELVDTDANLKSRITNMIIESIISSNSFKNMSYFDIKFIELSETTKLPQSDNNYEYFSILEKNDKSEDGNSVSIEYGASILNPYLVKNASDFNIFINQIDTDGNNIAELNYKSDKYLRLITDITFGSNVLNAETYNIMFSGNLDGNGMKISNLSINANTSIGNNAINKQQSEDSKYQEIEKYSDNGELKKVTSVGMFAKLIDGAVVKNIDIEVSEVYGSGVNFVGVVAGQVVDSMIYNINISGSSAKVYGLNAVGAIAGRVTGQSTLVNLTSTISVTASNFTSYNTFDVKKKLNITSKFNVYESLINKELDANGDLISNINKVSYAGGLVGIIDVSKKVENIVDVVTSNEISSIRNLVFEGSNTTLFGEIVGGIVGYVGNDSVISSNKVYVDQNSVIKASRVAGGLAGQNNGEIHRSSVSNLKSTQDSIDSTLLTAKAEKTHIYTKSSFDNDSDRYASVGSTKFFGSNAHFIGGIVGLNKEGTITNSYNKVNVNNINSLYAGGVIGANIGGQLTAVYTTADVYSFKAIGGIIGLNTSYYSTTIPQGAEEVVGLYIENYDNFRGPNTAKLTMQGIVGLNLWNKSSLNTRRQYINNDASEATIGSIIGYNYVDAEIGVDAYYKRMLQENMYTITTYTFDSIDNYDSSANKESMKSFFVLLPEIGNSDSTWSMSVTPTVSSNGSILNGEGKTIYDKNNIPSDSIKNYFYKDVNNIIVEVDTDNNTLTKVKQFGTMAMYSGAIVSYAKEETGVDGEYSYNVKSSSYFSRMRQYSSTRTLYELINRFYDEESAKKGVFTSLLNQANASSADIDAQLHSDFVFKPYDIASDTIISTAVSAQKIYPENVWSSSIWAGVAVNKSNARADNFVLPTHESRIDDSIVLVKDYEDLKQINLYPNRKYYLDNDIFITASEYSSLASLGNPFTGTLMSNPEKKSTAGYPYTIYVGQDSSGSRAPISNYTGIFGAVKGATFKEFNLVVSSNLIAPTDSGSTTAIGTLFGYSFNKGTSATTINNVDLEFINDSQIVVGGTSQPVSAGYVGGLGGYADSIVIKADTEDSGITTFALGDPETIDIINPSINITGEVTSDRCINMYVGSIFGYASLSSNSPSYSINVENPIITVSLDYIQGDYSTMAVGGIIGKLINSSSVGAPSTTLKNMTISDPIIDMEISAKDSGFANFETIAVGGAFGSLEGVAVNNTFAIENIDILDINSTIDSYIKFVNNGVYASSIFANKGNLSVGGTIGEMGGNSNGYITLNDIVNNIKTLTFTHSNTQINLENTVASGDINVGSLIGSVISCRENINSIQSSTTLSWTVSESDKLNINIGGTIGKMNSGSAIGMLSLTEINTTAPVNIGESTILNIGGLIGKMSGGSLFRSGYNSNIVVGLAQTSGSNVNIGGIAGFATLLSPSKISQSFASGYIKLITAKGSTYIQDNANLGGLIGYGYNYLNIEDSYSSNTIYTYDHNFNANYETYIQASSKTNVSNYNALGGIVGMFEANALNTDNNVQMHNVYSISNIIANKCENEASQIAGIIGMAETSDGSDIENMVELTSVYYLAEFMIEHNSIGQGLSVAEMLYLDEDTNNIPDGINFEKTTGEVSSIWTLAINAFPRLSWLSNESYIDPKLTPETVTTLASGVTAGKSYIVTGDCSGMTAIATNNNDIYFINTLRNGISLFSNIDADSRVYGIAVSNATNTIIATNNGKVSSTVINNLATTGGYIGINNGIDIHPVIKTMGSGAVVYGTNNGLVIYPNVASSGHSIVSNGNGQIKLGVFKDAEFDSSKNLFGTVSILDSYIYSVDEDNFVYYNHLGDAFVADLQKAQDINNFAEDYDFYNNWLILPTIKNGRMFLRWELKQEIGKDWYFEDIDLYSTSQTEYADYVWSNYFNKYGNIATENDIIIGENSLTVKSALGLAYASYLINHGQHLSSRIELASDIDMQYKLFTPIGGAPILEYMGRNYFNGSFTGNNHTIKNLLIITNSEAGLFGISTATEYTKAKLNNVNIITTNGSMGGLVAIQQGSTSLIGIKLTDVNLLHTMQTEDNAVVGGFIGKLIKGNKVSTEIISSEIVYTEESKCLIDRGISVGGMVGEVINAELNITHSYNKIDIVGKSYAGGFVGLVDENSKLVLRGSFNTGDVTSTDGVAGGFVGEIKGKATIEQCYNSSAVIGATYAGGFVGLLNQEAIRLIDCYVSRGDEGDLVAGVRNSRADGTMNLSCISGAVASAFVNFSSPFASVEFDECYSSLLGLQFTNINNADGISYRKTYVISESTNSVYDENSLMEITHSSLSEANNELFDDWSYIWSRVSQKNNNYPVLLMQANVWSGEEVNDTIKENNSTTYVIRNADELAWIAEQVNTGKNSFAGDTIKIVGVGGKIDFQKKLWQPIGYSPAYAFKGNVQFGDGSLVELINFTTNGYYKNNDFSVEGLQKDYVGLFGYMNGSTISGEVVLRCDETTENEGSHIFGKGNYVGAIAGYAKDITNTAIITNYLDVQGTGNFVGGIFGAVEVNGVVSASTYSLRATQAVSLGTLTNYGTVKGSENGASQYISGIIGFITSEKSAILNGETRVLVTAEGLSNYGRITDAKGNVGGIVAQIEGKGIILKIDNALNTSDLTTIDGQYIGGIVGYSNGSIIIDNATVSNDVVADDSIKNNSVIIASENKIAKIGSIVGYAREAKISGANLDSNKVRLISANETPLIQNASFGGAVGGIIGMADNLELFINSDVGINLSNVIFENTSSVRLDNNIGGIVGRVNGLLSVTTDDEERNNKITISGLSEEDPLIISGMGYLGGIAGYVNSYYQQEMDNLNITIKNVKIQESLSPEEMGQVANEYALDSQLFTDAFGNIGGAFGYVANGKNGNVVAIGDIVVEDSSISALTTRYVGGVVGRLNAAHLKNIKNYASINGDIKPNKYMMFVGGIVGSIGQGQSLKEKGVSTLENVYNFASVNGFSYVGGIAGEALYTNINDSASISIGSEVITIGSFYAGQNSEEGSEYFTAQKSDIFIGGLVGHLSYSTIDCENNETYTFKGNLIGSNFVGGIAGAIKNSNVKNAKVEIDNFRLYGIAHTNDHKLNYNNKDLVLGGGAVAYAENLYDGTQSTNYVIDNIDVKILTVFDVETIKTEYAIKDADGNITGYNMPEIGGIVGFARGYNLNEVSTDLCRDSSGNNYSFIIGTAQYLLNSEKAYNWSSNKYWFFNNSVDSDAVVVAEEETTINVRYLNNEQPYNYDTFLNMAYAFNMKKSDVPTHQEFNATVLYSLSGTNATYVNGEYTQPSQKPLMSETKQILTESGLWDLKVEQVTQSDTTKSEVITLKFIDDIKIRSATLENNSGNYSLEIDIEKEKSFNQDKLYAYIYSAVNKRYDKDSPKNPKNILIKIKGNIVNASTNIYQNTLSSLGTYYYPINNLDIQGIDSTDDDGNTIKSSISISAPYFTLSSNSDKTYNLYGLIGYVNGNISIRNIDISSQTPMTNIDNVQYIDIANRDYNTFFGGLIASAVPAVSTKTEDITHNIENVVVDIDVVYANVEYMGGIIGTAHYISSGEVIGDYTINLSNVENAGKLIDLNDVYFEQPASKLVYVPLVVGGVIGSADFINANGATLTINVTKNNSVFGVKNSGDITAFELAGGVFAYIGANVILEANNGIEDEYLIWNTGNITAGVDVNTQYVSIPTAGGVIGIIEAGKYVDPVSAVATLSDEDTLLASTYSNDVPDWIYQIANLYSGTNPYTIENTEEEILPIEEVVDTEEGSENTDETEETEDLQQPVILGRVTGGVIGRVSTAGFANGAYISTSDVQLKFLQNHATVGSEKSEHSAGIIGEHINIESIVFQNNFNTGKIYGFNSVAGIISSNNYQYMYTKISQAAEYEKNLVRRYEIEKTRKQIIYEGIGDYVVYNETTYLLHNIEFISTINASSDITSYSGITTGDNEPESIAGGLLGSLNSLNSNITVTTIVFDSCQSEGNLTADKSVGGFIGRVGNVENAKITLSTIAPYMYRSEYNIPNATFKSNEYAGGLFGLIDNEREVEFEGHIYTVENYKIGQTNKLNKDDSDLYNNKYYYIDPSQTLQSGKVLLDAPIVGGIVADMIVNHSNIAFLNLSNNAEIKLLKENYSEGAVTALGGIVGRFNKEEGQDLKPNVLFENCYNFGNIYSNSLDVGGIMGYISNSLIANLFVRNCGNGAGVSINTKASFRAAGGLFGAIASDSMPVEFSGIQSDSSINSSFKVIGPVAGGLVGSFSKNTPGHTLLENIEFDGNNVEISGTTSAGGLFGQLVGKRTVEETSSSISDGQISLKISGDVVIGGSSFEVKSIMYSGGVAGIVRGLYQYSCSETSSVLNKANILTEYQEVTDGLDNGAGGLFGSVETYSDLTSEQISNYVLTINNFTNYGNIDCSANSGSAGGVIGYCESLNFSMSFSNIINGADANITAKASAGGIIGRIIAYDPTTISLNKINVCGKVESYCASGGLIGENVANTVTISYIQIGLQDARLPVWSTSEVEYTLVDDENDSTDTSEIDYTLYDAYAGGLIGANWGQDIKVYGCNYVFADVIAEISSEFDAEDLSDYGLTYAGGLIGATATIPSFENANGYYTYCGGIANSTSLVKGYYAGGAYGCVYSSVSEINSSLALNHIYVSAYKYAGGFAGKMSETQLTFTANSLKMNNITFNGAYDTYNPNAFEMFIDVDEEETYYSKFDYAKTEYHYNFKSDYIERDANGNEIERGTISKSAPYKTDYSFVLGVEYNTFVSGGSYSYVCGSKPEINIKKSSGHELFDYNSLTYNTYTAYILRLGYNTDDLTTGLNNQVGDAKVASTSDFILTSFDGEGAKAKAQYEVDINAGHVQEHNIFDKTAFYEFNRTYPFVFKVPGQDLYLIHGGQPIIEETPDDEVDLSGKSLEIYNKALDSYEYIYGTALDDENRLTVLKNALDFKSPEKSKNYKYTYAIHRYVWPDTISSEYSNSLNYYNVGTNSFADLAMNYDVDGKNGNYKNGYNVSAAKNDSYAWTYYWTGKRYIWNRDAVLDNINNGKAWRTDCCGFISLVYSTINKIVNPYPSRSRSTTMTDKAYEQLKPGDVIWYYGTVDGKTTGHILMFTYYDTETGKYHFVDQSNLDVTGTWTGSYMKLSYASGKIDARPYTLFYSYL